MEIIAWSEKFENDIGQHEDLIESLETTDGEIKEQEHHRKVAIEKEREEERLKLVLKEEKCIVAMKTQISSEMGVAARMITGTGTYRPDLTVKAKITKLKITRFNGSHIDWFRFWNQYEAEINKSSLP